MEHAPRSPDLAAACGSVVDPRLLGNGLHRVTAPAGAPSVPAPRRRAGSRPRSRDWTDQRARKRVVTDDEDAPPHTPARRGRHRDERRARRMRPADGRLPRDEPSPAAGRRQRERAPRRPASRRARACCCRAPIRPGGAARRTGDAGARAGHRGSSSPASGAGPARSRRERQGRPRAPAPAGRRPRTAAAGPDIARRHLGRRHRRLGAGRAADRRRARPGVRLLPRGPDPARRQRVLRRGLVRPVAGARQRRPVHPRHGVLAGLHRARTQGRDPAGVPLPRPPRHRAPHRPHDPPDRPAAPVGPGTDRGAGVRRRPHRARVHRAPTPCPRPSPRTRCGG
jgi:hypothetical protein